MNPHILRAAFPLWLQPLIPLPFDPAYFDRLPLYDYQLRMLWELVEHIRDGRRRILLQLPTGGGKTFLATAMLGSADSAQFIVHRKELIKQTSKAFTRAGIGHSFVASGQPCDLSASLLLCGIATLARRIGIVLPRDLMVVDEAHHAVANTWGEVLDASPDAIVVGLTATPERLDGRGLGEFFEVMVLGPPPAELIARGFLSPFDYYAPSQPDMTGVGELAGDYNKRGAAAVMDQPDLIGDVVEHYLRHARGEPGLFFATSRQHSRNQVEAFNANGVRARHIDGAMSVTEREYLDEAFKAREFDLLSSVDLIGEGYDVPAVVYVGMGRPSKSQTVIRQQWGRNLRTIYADGMPMVADEDRIAAIASGPKPRAMFCDHANNWESIGALPDWDYAWSLESQTRSSRTGVNDDATPVHQCRVCYRVTPSTVRICPCGEPFPVQERKLKQSAGNLKKIEREEAKRHLEEQRKLTAIERRNEERECKTFDQLVALAERRGYPNPRGWAKVKQKMRSSWKQSP